MKLYNLNCIKKDLSLSDESNQSKQAVPNALKKFFSKNVLISFDRTGYSEQKRDKLIPAKIVKRNTTEYQGPKGNFCLTLILLPRVHSILPFCHLHFPFPPHTVPNAGACPSSLQRAAVTQRLEIHFFFPNQLQPCKSLLKAIEPVCWKLDKPVS